MIQEVCGNFGKMYAGSFMSQIWQLWLPWVCVFGILLILLESRIELIIVLFDILKRKYKYDLSTNKHKLK